MTNTLTEVANISWGKLIIQSIKGMIFGLLFFLGAFPLIWWNEGRSVDRIKTLDEGKGKVVSIPSEAISAANEAALVHIFGKADTAEILSDPLFGVQENALKLKRVVEMYQWQENEESRTKKNAGGSSTKQTTYNYTKEWSERLVRSSGFRHPDGHENPTTMPYQSQTFEATDIHVGAFELSKAFIGEISRYETYQLSQEDVRRMDSRLQRFFKLNNQEYFYGNPADPEIGAIRIRYSVITPKPMSLIGKQEGNRMDTYHTENGKITLLEYGKVGPESMFETAEEENTIITWLIRVGGGFLMWLGLMLLLSPFKVLSDVVPVAGSIVGAGIGVVSGVIALVLSVVTMALAWVFYRPLIGGMLLLAAAGFMFGGFKKIRARLADRSQKVQEGQRTGAASTDAGLEKVQTGT